MLLGELTVFIISRSLDDIELCGQSILFKFDTGVAVSAIHDTTANRDGILLPSTKRLWGPGDINLKVLGSFKAKMTLKRRTIDQETYVTWSPFAWLCGHTGITTCPLTG